MPNRPLPSSAAAALDIIVNGGTRVVRANDLGLHMQARDFDGRVVGHALKAFERRGWLIRSAASIEISEDAFASKSAESKKAPRAKRKHTALPRGLFGR